ncbi:MAG: hypothetical protein FJY85_00320 [Deltaproteobacteria bacterium]|nr:hypothetical protein [Deltaproteobacteria bacterium]
MKQLLAHRIAVGTTLVGVILMAVTIATGANPVEGSVITPFLTQTLVGNCILMVLLVTCVPAMVVVITVDFAFYHAGLGFPSFAHYLLLMIIQALLYYGLGRRPRL